MTPVLRESITADSSREWLFRRRLALQRYLRKNHHIRDRDRVFDLIFRAFPDEGKKLINNDGMSYLEKRDLLIKWIVHSIQITCLVFGDQGMGKDAMLCRLFELINNYCDKNNMLKPRIVTLGNIKKPPFVDEKDMYFSFKDIPFGTRFQPVYIYSSELDSEFPAREFAGEENKLFSILQNTMRQNHQKLFGCVKLASQVDISVLRSCNVKLFKYISPEKLDIEGVERVNILSDLGRWFLPKDVKDKKDSLLAFDNNLLTARWSLPTFWNEEYSEQFNAYNIDESKIIDFVRAKAEDKEKLTPSQINKLQIYVFNKFRKKVDASFIRSCFDFSEKTL